MPARLLFRVPVGLRTLLRSLTGNHTHALTHSLTHSITQSLADSNTHSLPQSRTHSHSRAHSLTVTHYIHSLTHSNNHSLTHSLAHSLTRSRVRSLARSLTRSLARSVQESRPLVFASFSFKVHPARAAAAGFRGRHRDNAASVPSHAEGRRQRRPNSLGEWLRWRRWCPAGAAAVPGHVAERQSVLLGAAVQRRVRAAAAAAVHAAGRRHAGSVLLKVCYSRTRISRRAHGLTSDYLFALSAVTSPPFLPGLCCLPFSLAVASLINY
jgi:hypothetical protein